MNIEELREYCISKPHVEETFPFNETTLVFKVGGKMFLLVDINEQPVSFNIKCDPEKAVELREQYSFVQPGFHMSKTHWNTVTCEKGASKKLLKEWIDDSYNLVIAGLPKKERAKFGL
ncbi:MAG: MmcQ/YjbR family DNA-binding protein [Bacteroidia bacterium]